MVSGLVTGVAGGGGGKGCLVGVTVAGTDVSFWDGGGACKNAVGEAVASLCIGMGLAVTSPKVRACGSAWTVVEPW